MRFSLRARYLFIIALVATCTWSLINYANQHNHITDFSRAARNSIDARSVEVLGLFDGEITLTAFVPDNPDLHRGVASFFARFQRHKSDLSLAFIDPRADMHKARKFGARLGEIVLSFEGRHERITQLSESEVTNALARLLRGRDRYLTFLAANAERQLGRAANHDISEFAAYLEQRGLNVRGLNFGEHASVPDNTAVLVIASPEAAYAPGELAAITRYVARGGNLLWLAEPDQPGEMSQLASALGVEVLTGTVVDPVGLTKFQNPAYAVALNHPDHPTVAEFEQTVVFPYAAALVARPNIDWDATVIAKTTAQAWNETGTFEGNVGFDPESEIQGELNLALALTKAAADSAEQRVLIVGDGDFLSNSFVANLGNREFGRRLFEWLSADDNLIDIAVAEIPDGTLDLAMWQRMAIFLVFVAVVPLGLLCNGLLIWWQRRHA